LLIGITLWLRQLSKLMDRSAQSSGRRYER
jgi:hypothetical protein